MSYGTEFSADIFLSRRIFYNQRELSEAIADVEEELRAYREILLMVAMSNPKDLVEADEDVLYATRNRVNDIIDNIMDKQGELTLLNIYQECINEGKVKFEEQ